MMLKALKMDATVEGLIKRTFIMCEEKESKAAQEEKNLTGLINRVFTNGESSIQDPSY